MEAFTILLLPCSLSQEEQNMRKLLINRKLQLKTAEALKKEVSVAETGLNQSVNKLSRTPLIKIHLSLTHIHEVCRL